MNMLSSLKALLFASTPMSGAGEGVMPGAAAAAPGMTPDFAQLLNASIDEGESPEVQPLPVGGNFVPPEGDSEAVREKGEPVGRALGRAEAMPLPPGLALGVIKHRAAELSPAPERQAPEMPQDEALEAVATTPSPVQPVAVDQEVADAPVVEQPMVKAGPKSGKGVVVAPEPKRHVAKAEVTPVKEQVRPVGDEGEQSETAPETPERVDAPLPAPIPVLAGGEAPPAPPPAELRPATDDGKAEAVKVGKARPEGKAKVAVAQAAATTEKPAAEAPEPVAPAPPQQVAEAPRAVSMPSRRATQPLPVRESEPKAEGAALPTLPDFAQPVIKSNEQPAIAPVLNGKPVKAEAAALLQIVRDQVAARQSGGSAKVGEAVSAAAHARKETPVAAPDPVAIAPAVVAEPSVPSAPSAPVAAVAATPPVAPTVDLSASLGAQVVDMGVSGQWIDGLARDVAGLSANGAQGRFQIHSDQLGAVQVDIRQGGEGAAVSLTVANEVAELALKQDSERLKIDAGLASVRIAEVKVERAPVTEAARTDGTGQQSQQQQSSHQSQAQNQSAWANGSQNMGQSQGQQGRWQTRENNGTIPKSSGDPAVLNHAEARQDAGDNRRTRYA